jgi:AMP deaminase
MFYSIQADKELYKRFDRFTNKYSPLGQPIIRNIFLKSDNYNKGRYIAELTKEVKLIFYN